MGNTVIKVENLSKQYRLGLVGASTFKEDASRWWAKIRGKEDPFLSLGVENDRTSVSESKFVWSLRDISFEVQQGDVLGIIGRNGAGKSTLLKILSKITSPTTGTVKAKGRIASLSEVGTGFHPELTGRENIFLNGAILGMRKHEIKSKLDEIIAFAGVERYIDTPVKRYSSGMYVRLAFAVAAHLENEILIIDEVLAVGDAEFQKKCLGKMGEVSKSEGRTVLFVSHNMSAVNELCNRGLLFENGRVFFEGKSKLAVDKYLLKPFSQLSNFDFLNDSLTRRGNGEARFIDVTINENKLELDPTQEVKISFKIKIFEKIKELGFIFSVKCQNNDLITSVPFTLIDNDLSDLNHIYSYELVIPSNTFRTGLFPIYMWIGRRNGNLIENYHYDVLDGICYLNFVSDKTIEILGYNSVDPNGYMNLNYELLKK